MRPRPPSATLFPYTTLFRSSARCDLRRQHGRRQPPDERSVRVRRGNQGLQSTEPEHHLREQRVVGSDRHDGCGREDRKSTRLNSSHVKISYAVFCLKKKNKQ